jgi:peptide/nickel transport system substrate-binding protein
MKRRIKLLVCTPIAGLLATSAVAQDGDLRIVFAEDRADHSTFDPRVTQSRHEEQVIAQVFDQLIAADSEGNFYPGLAKSWTISDDGLSYTFELRDDVTFHDGTPFNAEAVKFTFDTIVDPKTGSQGAVDMIGPYASTEVLGPYKVRVIFERPYGAAMNAFSETELSIVSPTAVQEKGATGFAQSPVGTGPFKFVEWEQGKQITLVRNDDYNWAPEYMNHQGPSEVAEAIVRFVPDASTRVAALEAGEVAITDLTPPLDMRRFAESDEFGTMSGNVAGLPFAAMFNTSRGPFQDINVRKAFMHSIDRPRLAGNLFFGFAEPAYGPLSATTPAYWPGVEEYYPFDLDLANQLLEDAGWQIGQDGVRVKDGQPLNVYFPSLLEPETAVALQADAARVGFNVNDENVLKARQDELILANDYDLLVIRWVSNDPGVLAIPFHSRNIPEPGVFKFNWARYDNPQMDQMLEGAASAPTEEERDQLYADIQKQIMDEAIFLPIHTQVQTIAYNADLTGLRFAAGNWQVRFYDIELAK